MSIISKAFSSLRTSGIRGLLLSSCNYLARQLSPISQDLTVKIEGKPLLDATSRYKFIEDKPFGAKVSPDEIDLNTINWFIPAFENSSGGHLTIFRLVRDLEKLGFKSNLIFESSAKAQNSEQIRSAITQNFLPLNCPIMVGLDSVPPAYFSFATNWTTAYALKNFHSTIEKCYLLQDYEPYFYPQGTDYYLANRTYEFGFKTFTGGDWIADKLLSEHQVQAKIFPFGCDTNFYSPQPLAEKRNTKRLLFYARPSTPRRGFELAMSAFEKLLNKQSNIEIILAGCDLSAYELPKNIKSVGIVSMADLPALYRSCDAALIISFTNVSLLPLDLMGCNCAVVSNSGPQVEWLLDDKISMLSDPEPNLLSVALEKILTDDDLRLEKIRNAHKFVLEKDWFKSAIVIAESLHGLQKNIVKKDKVSTLRR